MSEVIELDQFRRPGQPSKTPGGKLGELGFLGVTKSTIEQGPNLAGLDSSEQRVYLQILALLSEVKRIRERGTEDSADDRVKEMRITELCEEVNELWAELSEEAKKTVAKNGMAGNLTVDDDSPPPSEPLRIA